MSTAPRPRLVVFGPLPPMPTGIADYGDELLRLLAPHYACTAVVEDAIAGIPAPPGVCLLTLAEYEDSEPSHADALHVYHVGNNPDHLYMLPVLGRRPGLVVLHDPGLHHLLDYATAALGRIGEYRAAFEAEYGAPGTVLVKHWRDHDLRGKEILHEMPMLRQLLGPARHVVVHSRHAAHKVRCEAPETPVSVVPHPYSPPAKRGSSAALRRRLGIAANEIVFLSIGFVSHIKRIDTALRALARIAARLPPFRYVIAGELRAEELDVATLVRQLGLGAHVLTTGYVPEADFFAFIDMADIVVNLRWPVGGETSGTLIRALGSGACVVVVDQGPFAELPEGAAVRLAWCPDFEATLADTLLRLAQSPQARALVGAVAAAQIGRLHHPRTVLAAYDAAIASAAAAADRPWHCRQAFRYPPPQSLVTGDAPLWQRLRAMPLPVARVPLLRADAANLAALRGMGHAAPAAPPGWRPAHEAPRSRDLVFLHCPAADPVLAEADLAARLNRVLSFGGVLVLCVCAPGHVLGAHVTGAVALRLAGFRVELGMAACLTDVTAGAAAPRDSLPPDAPAMVWRAVKVSEFLGATAAVAA